MRPTPDKRRGLQKIAGCDSADRTMDVVFIHGLGGDAWTTWIGPRRYRHILAELIAEDFAQVGLWTLGYAEDSTKWKEESMPLAERGYQVVESLASNGLGERPLFFITDGIWGIVAPPPWK